MRDDDITPDGTTCRECGATIHPEVDTYLEILTEFAAGWGVGTKWSRFCDRECWRSWASAENGERH